MDSLQKNEGRGIPLPPSYSKFISITNMNKCYFSLPYIDKQLHGQDKVSTSEKVHVIRNVKNNTTVLALKGMLELSSVIGSHHTKLCNLNDEELSDDTRMTLGKNLFNGCSLRYVNTLRVLNRIS